MRYFITGSSGFIGKHMVKYLEDKGHEVIPLKSDVDPKIPRWLNYDSPFEFIHLSAYGNHYYQKDFDKIIDSNILDLAHLLKIVIPEPNFKKFYNISTSAIQLPTDTLYSVSKRFGELMVESLKDDRLVNIRPYSVYGPGEADHRFIPTVIRALHSGERIKLDRGAKHDWIYVDDFIEAMFDGYRNIGSGFSYSNWDIVFILQLISGKELNYEYGEKLRNYDSDNWKCEISVPHREIHEGLKQTYEWFTQKNLRDKQEA